MGFVTYDLVIPKERQASANNRGHSRRTSSPFALLSLTYVQQFQTSLEPNTCAINRMCVS